MKTAITSLVCLLSFLTTAQTPFSCSTTDNFGYYVSSADNVGTGNNVVYPSSRLSKLVTSTGTRTTLCTDAQIGVALNGLAFNPRDNFLYAVSRYDANQFSGKLYRLGENCAKLVIPVTSTAKIIGFTTNDRVTIDNAGGNISSGTFDLDNNYYVNTSYTNATATGFTNKIQKIRVANGTASVISTQTLNCGNPTSCSGTSKIQITDIIYDEVTRKLYGSNRQNNSLYSINAATGVITQVGTTGISETILGIYKNRFGAVRAIAATGQVYAVNTTTGQFTATGSPQTTLRSSNADAASGCYDPPSISGTLYNDANGSTDMLVNGTPTNRAGTTPLFVNLVQGNVVVKSAVIQTNGTFEFLGNFSGSYVAQISVTAGTVSATPPAQALPATYAFVGDFRGTGPGTDGNPDGRLSFSVTSGNSLANLRFGIEARPVAQNVTAAEVPNPGGNTRVKVPTLAISDVEDGRPTVVFPLTLPNETNGGILYYNNVAVIPNQFIPNFDENLFELDPADGPVTATFTYRVDDAARVSSNTATVTMPFTVAMPVKLTSFTGYADDRSGHVIIAWQTATQYNSEYFLVQRSTNGTDFEDIGRIEADGFSTVLTDYTYPDLNPLPEAYYRLMDVDFDGTFALSPTIFLEYDAPAPVRLYPTVVKQGVNVSYDYALPQGLTLHFYSMNGSLVLTREVAAGGHTVDLGDLPAGLYGVVISSDGNSQVTRTKIVKQ